MIFQRLDLQDFGVYRDERIDLQPPSIDRPVVLFGGLNGAGKTTLLEAIQLALYGRRVPTAKREGLSYDEYLRRCIRHGATEREGAGIRLHLLMRTSGKERTVTVARDWRLAGSGMKETQEVLVDGEYSDFLTQQWDEYIDEVIPAGVSHLFFFDGDRIERFADLSNSRELLRTAVHALLGLDLVDRLVIDLQVLERRKAGPLRDDQDKLALRQAEEQAEKTQQTLTAARMHAEKVEQQLHRAKLHAEELDARFRAEGGQLFERRGSLEERRSAILRDIERVREELRTAAAGSAPLLLVQPMLLEIFEEDRLDQEREAASILASVLKERDQALHKHALGVGLTGKTLEALEAFLASDRKEREAKASTAVSFGLSRDTRVDLDYLLREGLAETGANLRSMCSELDDLEAERDEVERQLEAVPDQDAVASLLRDRGEAQSQLAQLERDLAVARQEVDSRRGEAERAEASLVSLNQKAFEQHLAQTEDARVVRFSRRSRELLDDFRSHVLTANVERIQYHVLESFQYLLRKEGLVHEIEINPGTLSLTLTGDNGRTVHPDRLSAGERQLLALSLLWGMAKASRRSLPVVIDTPLGRLDSIHREHVVQRYFPNASHQVILLSTDEEIDQAHLRHLGSHVGRSYHLQYDDQLESTTVSEGYFLEEARR